MVTHHGTVPGVGSLKFADAMGDIVPPNAVPECGAYTPGAMMTSRWASTSCLGCVAEHHPMYDQRIRAQVKLHGLPPKPPGQLSAWLDA